jgi:hypothetical protein
MLVVTLAAACSPGGELPLLAPAAGPAPASAPVAPGPVASARDDGVPPFDPARFVTGVDHPHFPLVPGTTSVFREADGEETILLEVLATPKVILGVSATVVRDRVYVGEELVEDTFDWFAQDEEGNVWYLGEDVKNYAGGVLVDTEGSWEAGVDGARAGIAMLAHPEPGDTYFQEDAPGVAEDRARVRRLDVEVSVPYGRFADCLQTVEWTPLEPGNRGYKFYARGVGLVLESSAGGKGRVELISVTPP